MNDRCYHCGAIGACFPNCQCRKCVDPIGYQQWIRNQPGDWRSKAQADRANRIRLELNGQATMLREIWDSDQMFSALQNKLSLILMQALEKVKSTKDALSMRRMVTDFLRELGRLAGDLVELTKGEQCL